LAYTAGVVVSFVTLGGVLLTLRAAGEALGWGFQLQNPMVVSALAVLFTLIALNLLGVFEFGAMLPQSLLNARAKSPSTDAFLSGVLATAVASPCTAPFMGASLGLAIVWPTAQALAVFAALGVGMAAPYLLASWVPSVANLLPKPGAWMVTFKTLMAFPMLATVVWLMWVVGQQTSMNGAAALMLLLVMLAFAVWAWQQGHSARTSRTWRMVGAALLAISAWSLWGPMTQTSFATAGNSSHTASSTALWQTWTPTAVQERLDNGQTVFVDFTAAWCVTCQVNELTTLASEPVLTAFKTNNIALLKADWTKRDPAITQALNDLQRSGVPTYAVYSPGRAPLVLTEILSHAVVIAAVTQ
jgi:thiol:disulfide interchange protein DsbD